MKSKLLTLVSCLHCLCLLASAETQAPAVFADYLTPNVAVKGEIVVIVPPEEINKYLDKVEAKQKTDPKWFLEYSKASTPGLPLPFHEKLGLTKAEYDDYIKLWNKRELKAVPQGELIVRLEEASEGKWRIRVTGQASEITTMSYDAKSDSITTTSGKLERIKDINADKSTGLGAWTGKEWKLEGDDGFGITKENFAIGKLTDGTGGLIVYRLQEVSSSGTTLLYDRRLVIRFAMKRP